MRKAGPPPASPDDYVASLTGWQKRLVAGLREAVRPADAEETIKWGHLVYLASGPAFLIRAEESRVLLGFWRGQRLRELEPGLKPGGKYEMATMTFGEADEIDPRLVTTLVHKAVELNGILGDPQKDAGAVR